MTNPAPPRKVPEALLLADQYAAAHAKWELEDLYGSSKSYTAEKLAERHAARANLERALRAAHVQNPAEIEHVAGDVSKNGAEVNTSTQQPAPATQQAREVEGWLTWFRTPSGGREPNYSHGAKKPTHGAELDAILTKYPVYAEPRPSPTAQAASSAVLKAIREANMQLVRTDDDAFMLVPYKVATAQSAESVPAGQKRKDMLWSTAKMQERHDQRIENIVSGLERIKQEHAGQKPQKIDECYGDCPADPTTCTNPCSFDGRAARAPAESVPAGAERAAFEANWCERNHHMPLNHRLRDNGKYGDHLIQNEWEAWQARATRVTAESVPAPAGATPAEAVERIVHLRAYRERRIYVAGPMTGLPGYNFPLFNSTAVRLRSEGWHVENPAEHGHVEGAGWADYLRWDISRIATCGAIYLLPGWSNSKGATLEVHIAGVLALEVLLADGAEAPTPQPSPAARAASSAVLKAIRKANMQLVRTGDNAFMLVPYKVATAQAAESVPAVLGDDELVRLGKSPESGLHPWGVGTTRADYLRALRAVLAAARAPAESVGRDAILPELFREALAWGMTYGPEIPAHQWDQMRESMVNQYVSRAAIDSAMAANGGHK